VIKFLVVLGTTLLSSAAIAMAPQSIVSLSTTALHAMEQRALAAGYTNVEVAVRSLDNRLQLTACSAPVSVLPDTNQRVLGHVTVGLRCEAPERWTIHVRGNVSAQRELPTLVRAVNRGDIIGPHDVAWQTVQISREPRGLLTIPDDIVGKEARKHLTVGQTLRSSDLVAPTLIERGQVVDLITQTAGLQVNMQGKALTAGAEGDRLIVQNTNSGKRIEGVVLATGAVLVQ
jgi:flagella basal body P-ring formation protein FlgA